MADELELIENPEDVGSEQPAEPDCDHDIVIDTAVAPTCTTTGLTEGQHCSICGEVFVAQKVVDALGHIEGEVVVENNVAPDCTNTGSYDNVVYCSVCGAELSRETAIVPALGHTEVLDAAVTPTCTETGLTQGKHCSVCNAVLVAQEEVAATGHNFGDWTQVTAPTCTATGLERRGCTNCDHNETREVNALGHNKVQHNAQAATCTTNGWNAYETCTRCDYTTYAEITATGHTEGEGVIENEVDPDCITTGSYDTVVYCKTCGEELSREVTVIPALGHQYDETTILPDCETKGYTTYTCLVCGDSYVADEVEALGHQWLEATTESPKTCEVCGKTEGERLLTPIEQALNLYKEWVIRFHFFEGLTSESWIQLQTGKGLSEEDSELVHEWEQICSDPAAELNRAHHYIYTLIEQGRESELPEDIRELINQWNNH